MAQGAIPKWQNGIVAIGAYRSGGAEPTLVGTGWLVDLPAGLLCTCAHVVMDCYPHAVTPKRLDARADGVAIGVGIGETIRWLYRADLRYLSLPSTDVGYPRTLPAGWSPADDDKRLDLAVLQLTNSDGKPMDPQLNAPGSADWHRAGEAAIALPLGRSIADALPDGSELVLLGYGQGAEMGSGSLMMSTTCRGAFQGLVSKADTGEWLKTGLTIYSGHSGGPALNARGEVIGWAVKSFNDLGPNGQLRPVEQLEDALGQVLDSLVPARPSGPNVRHRLQGRLPAGTYCMGEEAAVAASTRSGILHVEMGLREMGMQPDAAAAAAASAAQRLSSSAMAPFQGAALGQLPPAEQALVPSARGLTAVELPMQTVMTLTLTGTFATFDAADFKERLAGRLQLQVQQIQVKKVRPKSYVVGTSTNAVDGIAVEVDEDNYLRCTGSESLSDGSEASEEDGDYISSAIRVALKPIRAVTKDAITINWIEAGSVIVCITVALPLAIVLMDLHRLRDPELADLGLRSYVIGEQHQVEPLLKPELCNSSGAEDGGMPHQSAASEHGTRVSGMKRSGDESGITTCPTFIPGMKSSGDEDLLRGVPLDDAHHASDSKMLDYTSAEDNGMRHQGAASSSTAAGKKRSGDVAGLDEPAQTPPKHRSTEQDRAQGVSGETPVGVVKHEHSPKLRPAKCEPPERIMATTRTISLVVTLPDDRGAALTELECEYKVDGANRATKETFKVDDPSAKQQVITLGVRHYLSLASRISSVRVKAANEHGWSPHFSPAAFDDEKDHLCCSPLDASLEELQAELQEADPQASRLEVLKLFLSKRQVPQLKRLAADLQIEGLPPIARKADILDSIMVKSSQAGSVDAAVLAAVTGKEQACAAAKAKLQQTQQVLDSKQEVVEGEDVSVRLAEADRDAAAEALAEAQAKVDAAEEVLKEKQLKAKTAKKAAKTALEEHEKEGQKVAKAEDALNRVNLLQEALKQAEAAPQPPPATLAIVDKSSGLDSADLASGRPAPEKLTPLKLKNRIKKWAGSDVISESSLQQCYKALNKKGRRDKATLIAELLDSYEGTVDFLRLPSAIPDQKLTLIPDKKLALIYTSNKDLLPPPPADGKDRAAMVNELASWLLLPPPRSSPTTTAIDATLAPSAEQAAITPAIVNVATLATPAEVTNQASITAAAAEIGAVAAAEIRAVVASQISLPLHRQPSTLNRVKRATVRVGLFDTTTSTIFSVGSGVVIRGACGPFAQVLTCAHTFIGKKKPYKLFGDRPKESVVILVGVYRNDQQTSRWRYRAELLTPDALLKKEVAFGQNGRQTLLDLAVLRVDRSIEITPSEFQGIGTPASPSVYQLGTSYTLFDDQDSCPLRSVGLELGDASAVATGSALSAAGWYSEHADKTIFVVPDFRILNKDDGMLKSNAPLDSGGSGGAQVNDSGEVVAINSMSMHVTLNSGRPNAVEAEFRSWGRDVDMLEPGHGLNTD